MIELIEIGAGGGSIARDRPLGLLKVGPDSAGAEPGPACYGRGGTEPTVTDADLVLGYLDPAYFLGGRMQLDLDAAERGDRGATGRAARHQRRPRRPGAIHQVVNENMANAARVHAIERGKDAARVPAVRVRRGRAGPRLPASPRRCGVKAMISPFGAGVGSTIGFLAAPLAFDFVRTAAARLDALDWSRSAVCWARWSGKAVICSPALVSARTLSRSSAPPTCG